jgi:hypothetical protein
MAASFCARACIPRSLALVVGTVLTVFCESDLGPFNNSCGDPCTKALLVVSLHARALEHAATWVGRERGSSGS